MDRDNLIKLDSRTVRLSFPEGRSYMPLAETWVNFGGIVPVDYHPVSNPVGAGPDKLKSFTPGQRSLFTRFENYYKDGKPCADELEIIDFKDQVSRLAALRSGQIDKANVMPTNQLEVLQHDPRHNLAYRLSITKQRQEDFYDNVDNNFDAFYGALVWRNDNVRVDWNASYDNYYDYNITHG